MSCAKLLAIAIFIGVAVFHVNPALWHPFMPFGWFSHRADGTTVGILAGASLVFFAYRGFQNVSIAAEEAKNPQRDVPIGVLASLATCTLIYLAVSGLLTAIAPYDVLNVSSPVAYALLRLGYNWGSALVAAGVIIGLTSTMLVLFYGLTRILFAMARDGLLPSFFSALDAKTRTPANAILLCGVTLSLVAGLVPLGALAELVNAGTLTEFMLVCIGVIVLRLTRPEMKRPFKAPGGVIIPVLGVLSCGALLSFLPLVTLLRFAALSRGRRRGLFRLRGPAQPRRPRRNAGRNRRLDQRGDRLARMRCKVRRCMFRRRAVSETLCPHNS